MKNILTKSKVYKKNIIINDIEFNCIIKKKNMIHIPKIKRPDGSESSRLAFPLLPLRDIVVFPHMVAPLFVGRTKSVNALTEAMNNEKSVFLAWPSGRPC